MRKAYSPFHFNAGDQKAETEYQMPSLLLMENAGRGACEILLAHYPEKEYFLILCGPGNNGGDGFVLARHLLLQGRSPMILATAELSRYKGESQTNFKIAKQIGIPILHTASMTDNDLQRVLLTENPVLIDCLLGTGSSGAPRGEIDRLLTMATTSNQPKISIDIPTGICADSGQVSGNVFTADLTITFVADKPGLWITPGAEHSGKVELCAIGIPPEKILPEQSDWDLFSEKDLPSLLPQLAANSHKYTRGTLLVVGGSDCYQGAPLLTALAALRSGCGMLILAIPEQMAPVATSFLPEAIIVPLPAKSGILDFRPGNSFFDYWKERCQAVVVGPGLRYSPEQNEHFDHFIRALKKPLLLDAGALDYLRNNNKNLPSDILITPHTGEAARLLGVESSDVNANRAAYGQKLSEQLGTAILKGRQTLILDKRGKKGIICAGGAELAVAGSGDVLSGIAGAFLASGRSTYDAAVAGALLHAVAGSAIYKKQGACGALASDIANAVAECVKQKIERDPRNVCEGKKL